jgi:polar amino acid transport system substrate-binding protein
MKIRVAAVAAVVCASATPAFAQADLAKADLAPAGTLRAAYLATNPAQSRKDPQTGEIRGASYDLARELAKRIGKPLDFQATANPPAVIEAVRSGAADIGFVAYEATRLGTVEFSQTYMLTQQSFLVLGDSPLEAMADVDRAGRKIAGTRNDSITLCMKRVLKQATLVELDNSPEVIVKALTGREVDALGANRQRLTTLMRSVPGSRLLPDNFFNVPQNIIVPKDKPAVLAAVDAFLDDVRTSGFLRDAVGRSGVVGLEVAQKSPGSQHGCPG